MLQSSIFEILGQERGLRFSQKQSIFTDLLIAVPFQLTVTLSLVTPKHPADVTRTAIPQHSHAIANRYDTHLITVTVMISTWICCCGKQI